MTSNELLYVKTIADERSITKAAKKLHISQPSLTQAVHRIEQDLGAVLFVRTSAGTQLTEAGRRYYAMADEILTIYRNFKRGLQETNEDVRGALAIGASWHISTYYLTEAISAYCVACPHVEVSLTEKNTSELEELFKRGELDLIFIHRCPFEQDPPPKSLNMHVIRRERLCLVAPASLNLSGRAADLETYDHPVLDLNEVRDVPMVRFREVQRIRQIVDFVMAQAHVSPPTLLSTYGFQNALELAAGSNAITFLPEKFIDGPVASGYPVEVFDIDRRFDLYWDICMCYRNQETYPIAMQRLLGLLERRPLA